MSQKLSRITVIASFMTDMVVNAPRRPTTGETIMGDSFNTFLGGKGFNQALAANRLGSTVSLIGNLGNDEFADRFSEMFTTAKLDDRFVTRDLTAKTGMASIIIEKNGDNSIIIVPGANMQLSPSHIQKAEKSIQNSDLLLMQQEVPQAALEKAVEIANRAEVAVMLNPAPAREIDSKFISKISIIVPNETEAAFLTGIDVSSLPKAAEAAKALYHKGCKVAIVTLGHRGAVVKTAESCFHVEGYAVDAVDTTAAGDAFCAALAFMFSCKAKIEDCVRFANAVGAMATTIRGAEPALPSKMAVDQFINNRPPLKVEYFD